MPGAPGHGQHRPLRTHRGLGLGRLSGVAGRAPQASARHIAWILRGTDRFPENIAEGRGIHLGSRVGTLNASEIPPAHDDLRFVRETAGTPCLAFTALNNAYGEPMTGLPPGKQKHRTAFGLLDPRQPSHHEAPPGRGLLAGKDGMTLWYRIITPHWADTRTLHTEDPDGDGKTKSSSGATSATWPNSPPNASTMQKSSASTAKPKHTHR